MLKFNPLSIAAGVIGLLVIPTLGLFPTSAATDAGYVIQGSGTLSYYADIHGTPGFTTCGASASGAFVAVFSPLGGLVSFTFTGSGTQAYGAAANLATQDSACGAIPWTLTDQSVNCSSGSMSLSGWPGVDANLGYPFSYVSFSGSGTCLTQDIPTSPCFTYTPQALTNACIELTPTTENVPVPTVGTTSTPVTVPIVGVGTSPDTICVIGPECVTVPVPTITPGSTTVEVPMPVVGTDNVPVAILTPSGYVEITVACGLNVPCHVDL
ncbi:MAG: hypothetical protein QOE90_688 [Thermoplasmata archaeon]|jgi:hypothetical protein|nr:hypothetical protein [Thermoplasmata archaeon]